VGVRVQGVLGRLKRGGVRDGDIAIAFRVDTETVAGWGSGVPVDDATAVRLDQLVHLVGMLGETLDDPGAGQWLRSANRLLGGRRPLDVLADGDHEQVPNAVQAFLDGVYL
jgi:hypothetical protein